VPKKPRVEVPSGACAGKVAESMASGMGVEDSLDALIVVLNDGIELR